MSQALGEPLAVLCSDIHLSHSRPVARAGDWYDAMAAGLDELRSVAQDYGVPIICAGDVFDRHGAPPGWGCPPELINFAIDKLPHMYAIPGQHDLPNHNRQEIRRSAYQTMVKAGRISPLEVTTEISPNFYVVPFPWGVEINPLEGREDYDDPQDDFYLAVAHAYVWCKGNGYPGAPKERLAGKLVDRLAGFDAAVFGDNHKGFLHKFVKENRLFDLFNCGAFYCRKSDETEYRPQIGILYNSGRIVPHYLDISGNEWAERSPVADGSIPDSPVFDLGEVKDGVASLGVDSLDFREFVLRRLDALAVSQDVRKVVLTAMGD